MLRLLLHEEVNLIRLGQASMLNNGVVCSDIACARSSNCWCCHISFNWNNQKKMCCFFFWFFLHEWCFLREVGYFYDLSAGNECASLSWDCNPFLLRWFFLGCLFKIFLNLLSGMTFAFLHKCIRALSSVGEALWCWLDRLSFMDDDKEKLKILLALLFLSSRWR